MIGDLSSHPPATRPDDRERARLEAVIDGLADLVVTCTGDGVVTYLSASAAGWLGNHAAGAVGRQVGELIDMDPYPGWQAEVERLASQGGSLGPTRRRITTPDGVVRQFEFTVRTYPLDLPGAGEPPWPYGVVLVGRSVEVIEAAQRRSAQSKRQFETLVEMVHEYIAVADAAGSIRYASPSVMEAFGATGRAGLGIESVHRADRHVVADWYERLLVRSPEAGPTKPVTFRLRDLHSEWRSLEVFGQSMTDDPEISGYLLVGHDVTDAIRRRREATERLALTSRVARRAKVTGTIEELLRIQRNWFPGTAAAVRVVEGDQTTQIIASHSLADDALAVLERLPVDIAPAGASSLTQQPVFVSDLGTAPSWNDPGIGQVGAELAAFGFRSSWSWTLVDESGRTFGMFAMLFSEPFEPTGATLSRFARLAHLLAIALQGRHAELELARLASHDPQTGLPGRAALLEQLTNALEDGNQSGCATVVLFCDLDRLKLVNDSMGHEAGDHVVEVVAERWRAAVGPNDLLGRFGGDEFMVIAHGADPTRILASLAGGLTDALREPFDVGGVEVVMKASIGAAVADAGSGIEPDRLIAEADAAMYHAKMAGRGRWVRYDARRHGAIGDRSAVGPTLQRALRNGDVALHWRPVVNGADGALLSLEAMPRCEHPELGWVSGPELAATAERIGLTNELAAWLVEALRRQVLAWSNDPYFARLIVGINLPVRYLLQAGAVDQLVRIADGMRSNRHFSGGGLGVGLDQGIVPADPLHVARLVADLATAGIASGINDFGTGHTSIECARQAKDLAAIKIGPALMSAVTPAEPRAEVAIAALVKLGLGLGTVVIADGATTPYQYEAASRLGCGMVIGDLFGPPVPAAKLRDALGRLPYRAVEPPQSCAGSPRDHR